MAVTKPAYDAQGWITADYAEMEVGTSTRGCASHTPDHLRIIDFQYIDASLEEVSESCVVRTDNVQGMHTVADQVHAMILLGLSDFPVTLDQFPACQ